ncbi:hypothetical protein FOMA001_g9789 [Fusarium oxysporum f. sp. matthiolae]|nr:hypothetical protein FOMA001_g9789 [Fusarium oxysporum f. sp. matthiolae]
MWIVVGCNDEADRRWISAADEPGDSLRHLLVPKLPPRADGHICLCVRTFGTYSRNELFDKKQEEFDFLRWKMLKMLIRPALK